METVAALRQDGVEPSVFVEQRLDMRSYVKDCFGTSDCVIIGGDTIVICDFKFGKLPVPATSPQLRIYALGACELFGNLYDFTRIRTVIYQPRLATVDEAEIVSIFMQQLQTISCSGVLRKARSSLLRACH